MEACCLWNLRVGVIEKSPDLFKFGDQLDIKFLKPKSQSRLPLFFIGCPLQLAGDVVIVVIGDVYQERWQIVIGVCVLSILSLEAPSPSVNVVNLLIHIGGLPKLYAPRRKIGKLYHNQTRDSRERVSST